VVVIEIKKNPGENVHPIDPCKVAVKKTNKMTGFRKGSRILTTGWAR
jgi:hypothetical protein